MIVKYSTFYQLVFAKYMGQVHRCILDFSGVRVHTKIKPIIKNNLINSNPFPYFAVS